MEQFPLWAWAVFLVFTGSMLALDLGVFRKSAKESSVVESLAWCGLWLTLAMAFNGFVLWARGPVAGMQWFTSYLVEICLSVDNLFVFILVFAYFQIPPYQQHRILFWGILGAAVMRAFSFWPASS